MVALCLNGLDDPEKQSLDGLLKKPVVNGGNNPIRRRTTERTAPLCRRRCRSDKATFCDARQVRFEPAVGSVASSARPTSS
jgi:hypothetical protein